MIFELKEGKFYPSSGNSAMLGVFERGRETEIKAFCDTSILHSSKVKNCLLLQKKFMEYRAMCFGRVSIWQMIMGNWALNVRRNDISTGQKNG